jgi:hypothetical protein
MSRPKSEATIQRERDRAIRKERREQKRAERDAKQEVRLKKQMTRESVKQNGIPQVQSGSAQLGIRDAIAYSPLVLCGGCGAIVRESAVIGDLCEKCKYRKEVEETEEILKEQGDKAVPGKGDGGSGTEALAGQLSLLI